MPARWRTLLAAKRPWRRARPLVALLLASLLFSCGPQEKKPQKRKKGPAMKAAAHMDGRIIPGRWTSVSVTLAGRKGGHRGLLGVSYQDEGGKDVTTCLDVDIPEQSKKIYRLPIRPANEGVSVWFLPRGGTARSGIPLLLRPAHRPTMDPDSLPPALVLLYGKEMGMVKTALGTNDTRVITADVSTFPERWYCLESASTVVFRAAALGQLDKHQAQALAEWVRSGGRVIADLRPGDTPPRSRVLGPLFESAGGTVIARAGTSPMAVERQVGLGTVVRLNVSITDPGVTLGQTPVLRAIVHPRPAGTACAMLGVRSDQSWQYQQWVRPVPAATAFLFLLGYLVLVGPVDYLVLKRLRRLEWTWCTFAVVSITATLLSLRWVYTTRVGAFTARTVSVAMLGPDGGGRTVAVTDLYSQKTDAYSFGTDGRKTIRPMALGEQGGMGAGGLLGPGGYRVRTDKGFSMESYHIPIWTHRLLRTDSVEAAGTVERGAVTDSWPLELGGLEPRLARLLLRDANSTMPGAAMYFNEADNAKAAREAANKARNFLQLQLLRITDEDVGFLITALAEYRLLMDASSTFTGSVKLTRRESAGAPFSVWGKSPQTTTTIYTITQDTNGDQQ